MIKVNIHNDYKEKKDSFGATLNEEESYIFMDGYGASEEEAINDLKISILRKIEELKNIDFSKIIYVDCLGEPINQITKRKY